MVDGTRGCLRHLNEMNPFEYVNSISSNKNNIMRNTDNDELAQKEYVPFLVNRSLSYFTDTLLYANEMNKHADLDNIMQYEYLFHSIRKGKRFSKWAKSNTTEDLLAISKYFNVNIKRAQEYKSILSPEQVQEITNIINNS